MNCYRVGNAAFRNGDIGVCPAPIVLIQPWIAPNPVLNQPWIAPNPVLNQPWMIQEPMPVFCSDQTGFETGSRSTIYAR